MDSGAHPLVGAAAADVAHGRVDVGIGGVGRARQQRGGGHQHAALAIAALGHLLGDPGLLQRVGLVSAAQRFNRANVFTLHRGHRRDAGAHRLAVHVHRASAAGGDTAAKFGAGEVELVAQHPQKRRGRVGISVGALAIDLEFHTKCARFGDSCFKRRVW